MQTAPQTRNLRPSGRGGGPRAASVLIPSWKIVPPDIPPGFVPRPRLTDKLAEALSVRLTLLVAGAGFGKSTLLSSWARDHTPVWYTLDAQDCSLGTVARGLTDALRLQIPDLPPHIRSAAEEPGPRSEEAGRAEAFTAQLCEMLQERLSRDLALIFDDAQEVIEGSAAARVIESLCRQAPTRLHVVLSSRADPPFSVARLRGRGQVLDIEAGALAFTPDEVVEVLHGVGVDSTSVADHVHAVTGGWPAAVRLAAEVVRSSGSARADVMTSLAGPGGPLYAYLAEEVLGTESPEVVALLRAVAPLDRFSRDLCEALGLADPGGALAALARKGLFVERTGDGDDWFRMNALVRDFVLKRLPLDPEEIRDLRLRAAVWLEANGHLDDAARSLQEAGDADELARFLGDRGSVLVDAGLVRRVVELADAIPPELRTAEVEITVGQARAAQGEWEEALASFRRAAGDAPELPPGLAWRMGFIHYFRGQPDEAMRAYARGRVDTGTTADEALLLAWTAALRWMEGDVDRCREDAELAHRAAMASGDLRALAAARTTLAMLAASAGDRRANDAHYLEALDAAERAGDLFQVVRIRTNRASHLYEEGWYEQAREELDLAIRLGEVAGFAPHLALALNNRGATWYHQGELELAVADFERSRALYQRMDSRRIAYPLTGLGNVYRERGELSLARASYEEAVRQAEPAKDLQGLVPALAGLARVIAVDDPAGARRMSQRAVDLGTGLGYVSALLAGGWVAFGDGDQKEGFDLGEQAAASARERRDRAGLAEALELQALATPDGPDAGLLEEAREIWRTLGNALAEARVELVLARFDHESLASQDTQSWVRRLEALGVRPGARAAAGPLAVLPMAGQASVGVSALGAFQVIRRGQPVPRAEWQSKKARALLKMLVARRGRPVHREALMEALWPDEDPELLANRLSVALTGVRTILDPDRQRAPEHYVTADRDTVALNRGHLDIDVERFLRSARTALDLVREGRVEEAVPALETAEAAYTGEFLEEDAYDDWAAPLREEARAAFVAVARALARAAAAREDHDSAIRYFLRLLERDPYDEGAHLGVVATAERARRHGEARRFYGVYVARMEEIDVEPAPFPALTGD